MNTITFPLKLQMKRPQVAHLHEALILLSFMISDAEQTTQRYGASTRAAVMEFQSGRELPATGEVDAATANAINAVLAGNGASDPAPGEVALPPSEPPAEDQLFSVQGEVVKSDGTPLPDYIVRAYDRALCDWRQLGDEEAVVRTDPRGRYVITYYPSLLTQWGKTRADLKVEVRDPSGDVVVAESPLILHALPRETLNFSIGPERYRGPDEFTRVERALAPFLPSQYDLSCLEVADVLILAREAQLPNSTVAYYVKAGRWSAEFDAPAAMFYGLMRRGEPTRLDALLARPLTHLWARLEEAQSRNLISLPLTDELQAQLAQLQQGYLSRPKHPFAQLLGTTALTGEQRAVFTQRLTAGTLTGDAFWQELETEYHFSAETVDDVQAAFKLQSFTGDNTSLTVRLRGDLGVRAPREVAGFTVQQWRDRVLFSPTVQIPDEVLPGGTGVERRAAYAQMLYRGAESSYATPSLVAQMLRDPAWANEPLLGFFKAHQDFEFNKQRVLNYLREHPQALGGLPDTARADLLGLEQLFHLAPPTDKLKLIQPMWSAGLRSAPQVAYLGRGNLMHRVGAALDAKTANRIYRKAVHVTSLALNVYLRYHPQLNSLSLIAWQTPPPSTSQARASSATTMPEWEELFGSPDACQCSHCESAISPAAYLVDTMDFLGKAVDASGNNALDKLLELRPDLGTLELTCENTETLVPHIDLVNEILEAIVASNDGKTLSGAAIGETTWDSDLLAAQPQYVNVAAYDKLRTASYPFFHLPFDLWAEEGRHYLRQMGIARHELMQTMPARPGVGALEIATEALGMSSVERDLIRQPKTRPEEVALAWGIDLDQGSLGVQLDSVESLIDQAEIDDYETFLRLLNTRYINPERHISVSFGETPCSLDGAVLVDADGADLVKEPFRAFLDRLHRFLRLQRRLACSEYELDTLIHALGVADFDAPAFFLQLAEVQALRSTLRLSLPELSALWADLDRYAFEEELSQYEAIYQNLALFPDTHTGIGPDLRNAVFALRADRADLAITTSTDPSLSHWLAESDGANPRVYTLQPDYAAYIQSATRLIADDVLLLVQSELLSKDATTGHVALNLANASLLYRMASLTQALKISVRDALRLFAITGVTPLRAPSAAASPLESRRFYDCFSEIEAGARSVEELAYLLLHETAAVAVLAPTAEEVVAWLASISPSFKGILAVDDERITPELKASLPQSLGSALGVDPAAFDTLFTHRPNLGSEVLMHVIIAGNVGAPGLPRLRRDFATVFGQLHKFGMAWNGLALDLSFLPFVLDHGQRLEWADIAALPMAPPSSAQFEPWRRLVAAANLQASTFTLEQSLFALIEDAVAATAEQAMDPASFVLSDFLAQISEWTAWSLADVTYLTGASGFNLTLPAAMRNEQALVGLKRVFDLIGTKGVAAEQAHAWAIAELTYAETQAIKQTLSLAYAPDRWLEILGSIQNQLRSLKRNALLGHALTTLGMEDSDAFYEHYLIDPAVEPFERTSRIVLAHSAVRLFAQRILMNLEDFTFEPAEAEAWQWRKQYRLWEAARRVFLYPENWLEPELRDDKSQFFKELEDALLQEEPTTEAAERIYHEYLSKVDQVSRLEILGLYEDTWTVGETNYTILHVVGRTVEVPAAYFYRRLEDRTRWTAWERIQLDFSGDHLIPIVYNGKLYLFWPEFKITELDRPSTVAQQRDAVADVQQEIAEIQNDIDAKIRQMHNNNKELPTLQAELTALTEQLIDKQDELEDLGVVDGQVHAFPATEDTFSYEIVLGMAWCTYGPSGTSPKFTSRETLTYRTNVTQLYHYFTGWVTSENLVRIAVQTTHSDAFMGYFYLDNTKGELHTSIFPISPPQGDVYVSGSQQKFQALEQFYFDEGKPRLELKISLPGVPVSTDAATRSSEPAPSANRMMSDFDVVTTQPVDHLVTTSRLLLATLTDGYGKVHYLHQHGLGGTVSSPFFFSTNLACYFVTQEVDLASLVVQSSARSRANGAAPAVASRLTSARFDELHFQSSSTAIIDRTLSEAANATFVMDTAVVGGIIAQETAAVLFPSEAILNDVGYQFTRFYDPYTSLFLRQVSRYGVAGLLSPDPAWDDDSLNLYRQQTPLETFSFAATYDPNTEWVNTSYPVNEIDFDYESPCGWSNWELFFHIPLLIATRLMQNQRYAEARQWFEHIFNPTATDGVGTKRFWRIKPFHEAQVGDPLTSLEALLSGEGSSYERQVEEWELQPFQPHAIARLRITAYMQAVVIRYLRCLFEEADMLFRRDTRESIGEARHLYLLASAILGDRPRLLPAQEAASLTPDLLLGRYRLNWNSWPLGNGDPLGPLISWLQAKQPGAPAGRSSGRMASGPILVDASAQETASNANPHALGTAAQGGTSTVDTLLLFCIPHNEMLDDLWNTVDDRLFKIRHSMNLSGQVRQLALFAPRIDPALLVRASALGISIEDILSGLYAPRSIYRFSFLLQKALELCGEVRSLGGAMLAALEKQDGEQVSLLRSTHEVALLKAISALKKKSVEEAEESLASLVKSREAAEFRAAYYAGLERVSAGEQKSLDKQEESRLWQKGAEAQEITASVVAFIPQSHTGISSFGPFTAFDFGGVHLSAAAQAVASSLRARAGALAHQSSMASITAGHTRRFKDWKFQVDLAKKEIAQLDKQILTAEIRKQIVGNDRDNHAKQIAQAQEVEEFLKLKFSNQQLHSWMVSKLASVHFQAYNQAYQLAVQAEAAFLWELGPGEQPLPFIKYDNWDSLKKGLMAGDLLGQQLRQLEAAHMAADRRALEITKHISLLQLDPWELLALRETGSCVFHLPEAWFNVDYPGHYYRRIKSVRMTIPCVVGPYTSISATLSLTNSWARRSTVPTEPLVEDTVLSPQIAIATSSANQDGGAFELNFGDPRYLPFEGAGAISSWSLELPFAVRPFNYATIADVILHMSYTAYDDAGPDLKASVNLGLPSALNHLEAPGAADATMSRLFSLRNEFPDAWSQLVNASGGPTRTCTLQLSKQHFPSFLDYARQAVVDQTSGEETVEINPITLEVKGLSAHLSPKGSVPADADAIKLNKQSAPITGWAIPTFDLPIDLTDPLTSALSNTSIGNTDVITCRLTIDGMFSAEDWNDLYLLMDYQVQA